MTIPRETIAAFADGELEGHSLREAEAAIAADPALQAQVDAHRALKARLSAHFAPIAEAAVPERLTRAVRGGAEVIDFSERARLRDSASPPRRRWVWVAGSALAASLVLAMLGFGQRPQGAYAEGEVALALEEQLVETQLGGAPVRILLSFRDGRGDFCRGFSSAARSGVACRDDRGWKLGPTIEGTKAPGGEYRQAGSADAEVLATIQDIAQGPALDAEAERNARARNWRK